MFRFASPRIVVVAALCTAVVALSAAPARAARKGGQRPRVIKVEGVVTAFDATAAAVTIKTENGTTVSVTLSATTRLEFNDAKVADLATFSPLLDAAVNGTTPAQVTAEAALDANNNVLKFEASVSGGASETESPEGPSDR